MNMHKFFLQREVELQYLEAIQNMRLKAALYILARN